MYERSYHTINSHVQNTPGSDNGENSVDILKYQNHHLLFIFRGRPEKILQYANNQVLPLWQTTNKRKYWR